MATALQLGELPGSAEYGCFGVTALSACGVTLASEVAPLPDASTDATGCLGPTTPQASGSDGWARAGISSAASAPVAAAASSS